MTDSNLPPKKKLTPLHQKMSGASEQEKLGKEIEQLVKDEANTLSVLAHGIRATAETSEMMFAVLEDIRDILVKVCNHTGMPLPARLQMAIEKKQYDPDAPDEDEDGDEGDEDDGDEDGDGDVLAKT